MKQLAAVFLLSATLGCSDDGQTADALREEAGAPVQAQTAFGAELRERAEQGDADAQFELGFMYFDVRDWAEAARWYRLAAEQENADAAFELGFMYLSDGFGVPKDLAETMRWYRVAADQGDAVAQYQLGLAYRDGEGVPQDDVQAHMWFNLSAARSTDGLGGGEMGVMWRDEASARMTPEQIVEAERLAREWDAAHPREP